MKCIVLDGMRKGQSGFHQSCIVYIIKYKLYIFFMNLFQNLILYIIS